MKELYANLRKLSGHVKIPGLPRKHEYLGEDYATSDEPWAAKLRADDAVFTWLAYSFDGIPMWKLHVGTVMTPDQASLGLHCHKEAEADLIRLTHEIGRNFGEFNDSPAAGELQYIRRFENYVDEDFATMADLIRKLYMETATRLRRDGVNEDED